MTLSGLANHASESRSNEDPLPDTEDGEKDGDDARGESNVKSSSCSSLATLGLSVEWEVSLATLRGPRGESPGSSFETSSGGGAGRVIRCGNGLARQTLLDRIANEMETYRENPAAMGRALGGAAGVLREVRSRMKLFLEPGSTVTLAAAITGNISEVRAQRDTRLMPT